MKFFLAFWRAPQKVPTKPVYSLEDFGWECHTLHSVIGDGRCHRWCQKNPASQYKRFSFQPANLPLIRSRMNPNSWGVPECLMGKLKIFPKSGGGAKAQNLTPLGSFIRFNIQREIDPRFFIANFLPKKLTKRIKNIPNSSAILPIYSCEKQKIICKEDMRESRTPLRSFYRILELSFTLILY